MFKDYQLSVKNYK